MQRHFFDRKLCPRKHRGGAWFLQQGEFRVEHSSLTLLPWGSPVGGCLVKPNVSKRFHDCMSLSKFLKWCYYCTWIMIQLHLRNSLYSCSSLNVWLNNMRAIKRNINNSLLCSFGRIPNFQTPAYFGFFLLQLQVTWLTNIFWGI